MREAGREGASDREGGGDGVSQADRQIDKNSDRQRIIKKDRK